MAVSLAAGLVTKLAPLSTGGKSEIIQLMINKFSHTPTWKY